MACRVCCIKLSLATRVIAMVGLITSVLVLTQLASELLLRLGDSQTDSEERVEEEQGGAISILLGLDIEDVSKDSIIKQYKLAIMYSFLGFALIYAVASALLVWGSIVESRIFSWPWLTCEAVSFLSQLATLARHGFKHSTSKDKWIILLSLGNMCLSIYFWIVVFLAQRSWTMGGEGKENETVSTTSSVASRPTCEEHVSTNCRELVSNQIGDGPQEV